MSPRELTSAPEIFEALGGISAIAEMTQSEYRTAANWKGFNAFPPKTYVVLTAALKERGYTAPTSLWGMVPIDQAG